MNKPVIAFLGTLIFALFLSTMLLASPLDEELQKLKQAGIPTTAEELNFPEIPDSENGAVVYRGVFKFCEDLYQKHQEEWKYFPAEGSVKWEDAPEAEKKKVGDLIMHNPDFIQMYRLLEKASLMKSQFLTKADVQKWLLSEFPYTPLPLTHLAQLRRCARLLCAKAIIELDYGSIDNALNACLTGLRLGRSISDEPLLISQFSRMSLDAIAVGYSLEKVMKKGEGDSQLYQALINEIQTEIGANSTNYGLRGELVINDLSRFSYWRKLGKEMFEFNEDDRKATEKTIEVYKKFPGDHTKEIKGVEEYRRKYKDVLKESYLKSGCKDPQAFIDMQEIFYLDKILKVFSLTKKPFWEVRDELQKTDDEIRKAPKEKAILTQEILQVENSNMFTGMYTQEARTDAYLGAAELGLANRIYRQKHGKFVDSLNQLTPEILSSLPLDPFTGKDYIYRLKDKGFIVYSVADNLQDDGGIPQFSEQGKKGDFDIVWEDSGAGAPIVTGKPLLPKGDGSERTITPPLPVPAGFPPIDAELSPDGKVEGVYLIVQYGRIRSDKVFEGGLWELTPDGVKKAHSGDIRARGGTPEGIIFVYNIATGKTMKLIGKVSMVYDRKTRTWTVSGSIVPK